MMGVWKSITYLPVKFLFSLQWIGFGRVKHLTKRCIQRALQFLWWEKEFDTLHKIQDHGFGYLRVLLSDQSWCQMGKCQLMGSLGEKASTLSPGKEVRCTMLWAVTGLLQADKSATIFMFLWPRRTWDFLSLACLHNLQPTIWLYLSEGLSTLHNIIGQWNRPESNS